VVDKDTWDRSGKITLDTDASFLDLMVNERQGFKDSRVQVIPLFVQRCQAREIKKVLDNAVRPSDSLFDIFDDRVEIFIRDLYILAQIRDPVQDRRQWITDLVGDTAGKIADDTHFFRMDKLGLRGMELLLGFFQFIFKTLTFNRIVQDLIEDIRRVFPFDQKILSTFA